MKMKLLLALCLALSMFGSSLGLANDAEKKDEGLKALDDKQKAACGVLISRLEYSDDAAVQHLGLANLSALLEHNLSDFPKIVPLVIEVCRTNDEQCRNQATKVFSALGRQPKMSKEVADVLLGMLENKFTGGEGAEKAFGQGLAIGFINTFIRYNGYKNLPKPLRKELETVDVAFLQEAGEISRQDPRMATAYQKLRTLQVAATLSPENRDALQVLINVVAEHPAETGLIYGIPSATACDVALKHFQEVVYPALKESTRLQNILNVQFRYSRGFKVNGPIGALALRPADGGAGGAVPGLHIPTIKMLVELLNDEQMPGIYKLTAAEMLTEITLSDVEQSPGLASLMLKALRGMEHGKIRIDKLPENQQDWSERDQAQKKNKELQAESDAQASKLKEKAGAIKKQLGLEFQRY